MSSTPEDSFVNVYFENVAAGDVFPGLPKHHPEGLYPNWLSKSSAQHSLPDVYLTDALRKLYPDHSIVLSTHYALDIRGYPGAATEPLENIPMISRILFASLPRSQSPRPGVLFQDPLFGGYKVSWQNYEFLHFTLTYFVGYQRNDLKFTLHKGPEEHVHSFLLSVGIWANELHDEIWVFDSGFWQKDRSLFLEIQKANWDDVILDAKFKKAFRADVKGFFTSEEIYKKLAIPWKRGVIMHGPPGNGKTISLKAVMKDCYDIGYSPLYVKSFKSWAGEEFSINSVFEKARELAPCVVVLEDLDSLINDSNRSFFLNQLDGLSGNDGLLVIATTNHFDRLDPALSSRPSRFDRKFLFDDPTYEERILYAKYWQEKLKDNKDISFPDELVKDIASWTDEFSFAYLKEAFVSSLVTYASHEGDPERQSFASMIYDEIKELKKQLDKPLFTSEKQPVNNPSQPSTDNFWMREAFMSGMAKLGDLSNSVSPHSYMAHPSAGPFSQPANPRLNPFYAWGTGSGGSFMRPVKTD